MTSQNRPSKANGGSLPRQPIRLAGCAKDFPLVGASR